MHLNAAHSFIGKHYDGTLNHRGKNAFLSTNWGAINYASILYSFSTMETVRYQVQAIDVLEIDF